MNQKEFDVAVKRLLREMERDASVEARKRAREEIGMIYVKEFTVRAHFRKWRRRTPARAAH